MFVTILLSILVGLVIGDILCFIVYEICRIIHAEENGKEVKLNKNIFKVYLEYVLKQLKERNKSFIIFYLLLDIITVSFTRRPGLYMRKTI